MTLQVAESQVLSAALADLLGNETLQHKGLGLGNKQGDNECTGDNELLTKWNVLLFCREGPKDAYVFLGR